MMKFYELVDGEMFTFHSFSQEVWRKENDHQCMCVSYPDEDIDTPHSLLQTVFPITPTKPVEDTTVDNFQPMSLILALRKYMKDVRENVKLEPVQKEYIALGLAWAICEIKQQATAKDRFITKG